MITITIGSFKGGTSKTTSSLNIGYSLSLLNKRTLLLDLDPQGNLTSSIGCSNKIENGISEVLYKKDCIRNIIIETDYENLFLIPSSPYLEDYREFNMNVMNVGDFALTEVLNTLNENFDFCIVDTPPSLGMINKMAFLASDYIIPCISIDPFSILGLQTMIEYIERNIDYLGIEILGVLVSFWEKRSSIGKVLEKVLEEKYPGLSFVTKVRRDASVNRSVIQEKPVIHSFSNSRASKDYLLLSKELLNRINRKRASKGIIK